LIIIIARPIPAGIRCSSDVVSHQNDVGFATSAFKHNFDVATTLYVFLVTMS